MFRVRFEAQNFNNLQSFSSQIALARIQQQNFADECEIAENCQLTFDRRHYCEFSKIPNTVIAFLSLSIKRALLIIVKLELDTSKNNSIHFNYEKNPVMCLFLAI